MYGWFVAPTHPLLHKPYLDPSPTPSMTIKHTDSLNHLPVSCSYALVGR